MRRGVMERHRVEWIVPRRVMCAFFWVGIVFLFTGIILMVTSKHRGRAYKSWGGVLLGLGFCLLLICFILCMHAYCVITVADEERSRKAVAQFHSLPPPSPYVNGRTCASPSSQRQYAESARQTLSKSPKSSHASKLLNEKSYTSSPIVGDRTYPRESRQLTELSSLKLQKSSPRTPDLQRSPKKSRTNAAETPRTLANGVRDNIPDLLENRPIGHKPPSGADAGKYSVRHAEKRVAPSFSARVKELPIIHEDPIPNGALPQVRVYPAAKDKFNYTAISTQSDDAKLRKPASSTSLPSTLATKSTDSNVTPRIPPPPPNFRSRSRNSSSGSLSSNTSSETNARSDHLIGMESPRARDRKLHPQTSEDSAFSMVSEETSSATSLPTVVFLSNEHGITESKVSIYDNVQYIHL